MSNDQGDVIMQALAQLVRSGKVTVSVNEDNERVFQLAIPPATTSYLYLVKSQAGCYATLASPLCSQDERDEASTDIFEFLPQFCWSETKSDAVYFPTKEAADEVARACAPQSGARVVRVKR